MPARCVVPRPRPRDLRAFDAGPADELPSCHPDRSDRGHSRWFVAHAPLTLGRMEARCAPGAGRSGRRLLVCHGHRWRPTEEADLYAERRWQRGRSALRRARPHAPAVTSRMTRLQTRDRRARQLARPAEPVEVLPEVREYAASPE